MKSLRWFLLLVPLWLAAARADDTETIVCLRHGEKTPVEVGQLSVTGLNRALALPKVLLARYGKPQYLFAPDPAINLTGGRNGEPFQYYLRPLATIEPTAIFCGLPVNTAFGFKQIDGLEHELLAPHYQKSLIFVAWEHNLLAQFIAKVVADVGHKPSEAIAWPSTDFDSLYVIRLRRSDAGATVSLAHEQEGLIHLSERYPEAAP